MGLSELVSMSSMREISQVPNNDIDFANYQFQNSGG